MMIISLKGNMLSCMPNVSYLLLAMSNQRDMDQPKLEIRVTVIERAQMPRKH